ncbi:glycoside hydrolase family 9 protein [Actinoplanes sp. NPDC089786]|uniref:glycoside hydrolase family 9 protein n=1 Tax=Actinoplanes sp. NPDC089786 TaxID=3155185 RepID=UPI003419B334
MIRHLLLAAALVVAPASPSTPAFLAAESELVVNGAFDGTVAPWYSSPPNAIDLSSGHACLAAPGGTANRWDVSIGQSGLGLVEGTWYRLRFFASGTYVARAMVGQSASPYTTYFEENALLTEGGGTFEYTFRAPRILDGDSQVAFQVGGSPEPWRFCLDDVSLVAGVPPAPYAPDTGPPVRVNQAGYLPYGPKNATLVTESTTPATWELRRGRAIVANGRTKPRGVDVSSGQNVHSIDFSRFQGRGIGFTLTAGGFTSRPFTIDPSAYDRLSTDALKLYYTQRSGVEIRSDLRPGYARPAGHVDVPPNQGDGNVPCQPGVCDYRLDVTGGWYDAGDHGKYVVNGGISAWQLMNQYETGASRARSLAIPESGDGVPDLLDEVRWELDFMLAMQVPAGQPLAGMVHHKIHDRNWTGLPLWPHLDPELRELHPVSTAATLNLAATAAQAARLYGRFDRPFAARSLAAARTAFAAAVANPDRLASDQDGVGGGTYSDAQVGDEFYWAAAELYLTTGEQQYADRVLASPYHTADVFGPGAFDWGNTAAAARLDLAQVPSRLPGRARVVRSVVQGADKYVATQKAHPYAVPYAPPNNSWDWGSNSLVLNNLVVIGSAYHLTGRPAYRDATIEGMDYILGRNALNISYVTGYGQVNAHNQHSRWYAHSIEPTMPNPPVGTLAGGPNSSLQDPYAQSKLTGCVAQFCYIDHIQSWSTNELTINWNASLSWVSAFVAAQNGG